MDLILLLLQIVGLDKPAGTSQGQVSTSDTVIGGSGPIKGPGG